MSALSSFCTNTTIINWKGVYQIVRPYLVTKFMAKNGRYVRKQSEFFFGPEITTYEVDFNKLRSSIDSESIDIVKELHGVAKTSKQDFIRRLEGYMEATRKFQQTYRESQRLAQQITMGNIDRSVQYGETSIENLKTIRDLSATTLMVGATIMTGGAAEAIWGAGALGGEAAGAEALAGAKAVLAFGSTLTVGSALKATAKYQDTDSDHRVASTATEFVLDVGFGLVGIGVEGAIVKGTVKKGSKFIIGVLLAKVQGAAAAGQGVIEGKTLKEGVASGGIKMAGAFGVEGIKATSDVFKLFNSPSMKILDLIALPVYVAVDYGLDKLADRAGESQKPESRSAPVPPPNSQKLTILDAVAKDDEFIKKHVFSR